MLKKITQSPYLNLLSGLILLTTAGYESWISFENFTVGAHHGLLIFSLIKVIKCIPDLMYALKDYQSAKANPA